ncbi:NAD/NADP octopine/nopaline dehydrogenase family protein [Actinoplanes sp. NPDC049316]|uniref:NAD/NADP octopine/nopaline dehydrogenase family protein n=1 Tax=Actinoplanes sp. NPDC049316 TaxID=3154727 RepID=UPI00344072F1
MTDIAVIGAGHVGLTLLTDLVSTQDRHGLSARALTVRDKPGATARRIAGPFIRTNMMNGEKDRVELRPEHFGQLSDPRTDGLLEGARHIIVTVPDIPSVRLRLLDRISRLKSLPGKVITFVRAGQGGQPVLAEWARRTPELRDTSLVLIEDSFYGTRAIGTCISYKRKLTVNVSIYSRTPEAAADDLRALFPLGHLIGRPSWPDVEVRPGIGLQFDPLGYIIHVGIALDSRNLERTRAGIVYQHYTDGVHRELAEHLDALDQERVQLAAAYGVEAQTFPRIIERQYGIPYQSDFYQMMQSCREIYRSVSCASIDELKQSRIVREDIPGLRTMRWLADAAGIRLPATERYEAQVMRTAAEIDVHGSDLVGYVPELSAIPASLPHLTRLLTTPHDFELADATGRI